MKKTYVYPTKRTKGSDIIDMIEVGQRSTVGEIQRQNWFVGKKSEGLIVQLKHFYRALAQISFLFLGRFSFLARVDPMRPEPNSPTLYEPKPNPNSFGPAEFQWVDCAWFQLPC